MQRFSLERERTRRRLLRARRRVLAIAVDVVLPPPGVDPHIATLGPTQLLQPLCERHDTDS